MLFRLGLTLLEDSDQQMLSYAIQFQATSQFEQTWCWTDHSHALNQQFAFHVTCGSLAFSNCLLWPLLCSKSTMPVNWCKTPMHCICTLVLWRTPVAESIIVWFERPWGEGRLSTSFLMRLARPKQYSLQCTLCQTKICFWWWHLAKKHCTFAWKLAMTWKAQIWTTTQMIKLHVWPRTLADEAFSRLKLAARLVQHLILHRRASAI